jgi:hypothetical protein
MLGESVTIDITMAIDWCRHGGDHASNPGLRHEKAPPILSDSAFDRLR